MMRLYTNYISYKNIIINKLIEFLKNNNTIKTLQIYKKNNFYKKTPLEVVKYLYKNYFDKSKIIPQIDKNIIKKLKRDDFDILLDFANIKIKNIKKPIYGILFNNKLQADIYKILYYNNKIIKFIKINVISIINNNIITLYTGNYTNVFTYINEFYNILKYKSNNQYISAKYSLLVLYNSIILSIIYMNDINKLNYSLSNILIVARRISNFVKIIKSNNEASIEKNNIFSLQDVNIINTSLVKYNTNECYYYPIPISISSYTRQKEGLNMLKLNTKTNNLLYLLNSIYMKERVNWSVDSNINMIFSNLTLIGSGWYRLFYEFFA